MGRPFMSSRMMALIDIVNTGYVNTGYRWHRRTSGQRDRILDQITRPAGAWVRCARLSGWFDTIRNHLPRLRRGKLLKAVAHRPVDRPTTAFADVC